ncbi:MAG: DUF4376 domain-containing protein [Nitrosomonas sp.]|nr:DUF4376 domain-containing protein [Nitrosomonas sp.]
MKIIKLKSNNIVIFAGTNLAIENNICRGDGWTFDKIDVTLLEIETVENIPAGFVGGGWTYSDGIWAVNEIGEQSLLPAKRLAKIAELEATRLALEYSDIDHAGQTWRADKDSRTLLAQVLAPGSVPAGAYWRDASGTKHTMTYSELQALGLAISTRGYDADEKLETKKAAVAAAATAEEIDLITWES